AIRDASGLMAARAGQQAVRQRGWPVPASACPAMGVQRRSLLEHPERRRITVLFAAIHLYRARTRPDRRCFRGDGDYIPALDAPHQAATAKDRGCIPAQRSSLRGPAVKETATVIDYLLPPSRREAIRRRRAI